MDYDGSYGLITNTTVLDGVVIASAQSIGIAISGASPLIANCLITSNASAGIVLLGGAPVISNCTFAANTFVAAGVGAGASIPGKPLFEDSIFMNNSSSSSGSAILNSGASATIANCLFANNVAAGTGGAIVTLTGGNTTIINSSFFMATQGFDGADVGIARWKHRGRKFHPLGRHGAFHGSHSLTAETTQIAIHRRQSSKFLFPTIEGLSALGGNNNSAADPLFAQSSRGRFHALAPCSPAI